MDIGFFIMKHTSVRIIFLLLILSFSLLGFWCTNTMHSLRHKIDSQTLIIAHRGSSSTAPENSLVSIEQAILSQADLIELDVHLSTEGELLVMHDHLVQEEPIWSFSKQKFLGLDITKPEKFAGAYTDVYPLLLEETLASILHKSTPLIEYKLNPDTPEESAQKAAIALINLLYSHNWQKRVVIQSFDVQFLAYCRSIEPDLILGWLIQDEIIMHIETIEREINPEIIAWKREMLTTENIAWIKERSDARIWSWYSGEDKANDPAYTLHMLQNGIEGIITDYPAQARVVLKWNDRQE